jgi:hypothetical protein
MVSLLLLLNVFCFLSHAASLQVVFAFLSLRGTAEEEVAVWFMMAMVDAMPSYPFVRTVATVTDLLQQGSCYERAVPLAAA